MDGEDSRQNPSGQGAGAGGAIIGAMTRFGKAVGLVRGGSHEEEDDRHGQEDPDYPQDVQQLHRRLAEYYKIMNEQVRTISAHEAREKELQQKVVKLKQELGLMYSKLQHSAGVGGGDGGGEGGDTEGVRNLRECMKEQAQVVLELKGKIAEQESILEERSRVVVDLEIKLKEQKEALQERNKIVVDLRRKLREQEDTLQMAGTDKDSYDVMLQEAEDDRDKVKEDFESAKEEIRSLQREISRLKHSYREEAMTPRTESASGKSESNDPIDFNQLVHENELNKDRVAHLERVVAQIPDLRKQIGELELAKTEVIGEMAAIRAEAEIYKADFLEERKDREKARGELADIQKKRGGQVTVLHEERAQLYKEINTCKQACNKMRTEHARTEAKLKEDVKSARAVIAQLKSQVEKDKREADSRVAQEQATSRDAMGHMKLQIERISKQRDDYKHEVEQKKASKKQYDRLKEQFRQATATAVGLTDQLDKMRKEKKELEKAARKLEEKLKKAEKAKSKAAPSRGASQSELVSESRHTEVERLYGEERDKNEKLEFEMKDLKEEIEHHKTIAASLKCMIKDRDNEATTPGDSTKTLGSLPSNQMNTDQSEPFQNDSYCIVSSQPEPELDLRQQLDKNFIQAKQMSTPQVPSEAAAAYQYNQARSKTQPNPQEQGMHALTSQRMERGDGPVISNERKGNKPQQGSGQNPLLDATLQPTGAHLAQPLPDPTHVRSQPQPGRPPQDHPPQHHQPPPGYQSSYQDMPPLRAGGGSSVDSQYPPDIKRQPSSSPSVQGPAMGRGIPYIQQPSNLLQTQGGQAGMGGGRSAPKQPPSDNSASRPRTHSTGGVGRHKSSARPDVPNLSRNALRSNEESTNMLNIPDEPVRRASFPVSNVPERQPPNPPYTDTTPTPAPSFKDAGDPQAYPQPRTNPGAVPLATLSPQTSREDPKTPAAAAATRRAKDPELEDSMMDENVLVERIDSEISHMAADVQEEVSMRNERMWTMEQKPFDPNLVCPMCGRRFRIGEIQKFRRHVSGCDGEEGDLV